MHNLGKRSVKIKTGNEYLTFTGKNLDYSLINFWKWSVSDLLSNTSRGIFAEFIVASALNLDLSNEVRNEWSEYDLEFWEWGNIKIEVKSSSYLQTWDQSNYSNIIFSIKKRGKTSVSKQKNVFSRPSNVYVFCLLHHKDKKTVDPLNMDQWSFYVISTKKIDELFVNKNSISLNSLEKITEKIKYNQLKESILIESKK